MNRREYQQAFSKLEPSQALVDSALRRERPASARRKARLGNVLLAAALAVAVLAGTVYAAAKFQWFRLGGAETVVEPAQADPEAFGKAEGRSPAPQNLLTLEGEVSSTYVGFTLPAAYGEGQDNLNSWRLNDSLYRRYYRNPDPEDPASPLLTIEIVYNRTYLTRYASAVVKEEELGGLQTVWLRLEDSPAGRPEYCLFQRNEALGCFALIASTTSFAEAEQAAADMVYADSGIPMVQAGEKVRYGFRLGWTPEDMDPDSQITMADRWDLANATLGDPTLRLEDLNLSRNWVRQGEEDFCNIGISLESFLWEIAPVDYGTELRSGTLCGHPAHWVLGYDGNTYIRVVFLEEEVQLYACVSGAEKDPETGEYVDRPATEEEIALAERILESAELVPVTILEDAPMDLCPFSVG